MNRKLGLIALAVGLSACSKCDNLPAAPIGEYSVEFDNRLVWKSYRCESDGVNQTSLLENGKMIGLKGKYKDVDSGEVSVSYGYNPVYDSTGEPDSFDVVNERCKPYESENPLNYTESTLKEAKKVCDLIDKCHELLRDKYKLTFF